MTARPGAYQPRFTAGQLDGLMQQNTDLKMYNSGAARMTNVVVLPQGGFTLRNGLRHVDLVRHPLEAIAISGETLAAAAGGTAANAADGDAATRVTTTALTGEQEVFRVTFATDAVIAAVDLIDFVAHKAADPAPSSTPPPGTAATGTVKVETYDGATWTQLDVTMTARNVFRSRRFAIGPRQSRTVEAIRVLAQVTPDGELFSFSGLSVWKEATAAGVARVRPFSRTVTDIYDFAITGGNAEVYDETGRTASIALAADDASVPDVRSAQKLDTMVMFHKNIQPWRISWQGAAAQWSWGAAPFENIPNYNFGLYYANAVASVWELKFFLMTTTTTANPLPSGGASIVVTVSGQDAPAIQIDPAWLGAGFGTDPPILDILEDLIEALPGVNPGIVVSQVSGDAAKFRVTFSGQGNEGDGWAISVRVIDKADAAVTSAQVTVGDAGGEPVMSASRGWPRCGVFYGQRLVMGGFRSLENAMLASEEGDFWQLDTRLRAATAPMLIPLDTKGNEAIEYLVAGRTLTAFTNDGEYWLQGGGLARTSLPVFVLASENGLKTGAAPFDSEGALIYAHKSGAGQFEFKYDFNEQNYISLPTSVQTSDLVRQIADQALRKLAGDSETNVAFGVRDDGLGFMCALLRRQEITAYSAFQTPGLLRSVGVNGKSQAGFIVERTVDGDPVLLLEREEHGLLLDGAVRRIYEDATATIDGLELHEGESVWAIANGFVYGPHVVSEGEITISEAVTLVDVGRWTPPLVQTLPLRREVGQQTVVMRGSRVTRVWVHVRDTTSIAVGANGGPVKDLPLYRFGSAVDTGPLDRPFTGWVEAAAIQGYADKSEDNSVVITQLRPGKLTVTAVAIEADK